MTYTLRSLYEFCRDNAVDCELHVKPDGRCFARFDRFEDRAIFNAEFDFEHSAEHLPEAVMGSVKVPRVKTDEERAGLERPR